ncbi:MAG: hypothetical protein GY702_24730 [Desulfobulbaceae bacterium]|nr:hypothetical protein [Desulfobulbaceae bacterium]
MTIKSIPKKVKEEISNLIEQFNQKELANSDKAYIARFKGKFLFLDRNDYGNSGPICRLKYTGKMNQWEFSIYKYSRGGYSPDECFFPGEDHIDGTIQGAMLCGLEAYH